MAGRSRFTWAAVVVLGVVGAVASCGSNGSTASGGNTCTPGAQTSCACLGGKAGIQVCNVDGKSLGMCQCSSGTASGGTGGATTSSSSGGLGATGTGGGSSCQCSNPGGELYCGTVACADAGSGDAGTGDAGDAGNTSCTGALTFAGLGSTQLGSKWDYGADMGSAAGDALCQAQGADHVCDFDDIVYAASKGEFAGLTTTDNAWLVRTHSVTVGATDKMITQGGVSATVGQTYKVGQASRCANWSYSTDHLNDGEWVDFSTGVNTPTFHIDNNPCAIQMPNPGKDSPCGHNTMPRSVLCCYAKNACNPAKPSDDCVCNTTTNTCM
jgi:hypothetical protein